MLYRQKMNGIPGFLHLMLFLCKSLHINKNNEFKYTIKEVNNG